MPPTSTSFKDRRRGLVGARWYFCRGPVRLTAAIVMIVLASGDLSLAHAQEAVASSEYPIELVDRPLLMLAGMSTIDFGVDVGTVIATDDDAMGIKTMRRVATIVPSVLVSHCFGAVEVFAATDVAPGGDSYDIGADIRIGALPGVVQLSVSYDTEEDLLLNVDDQQGHAFGQRASYSYKAFLVPNRFSVGAAAGVSAFEGSRTYSTGMTASETVASAFLGVGPQLQITRRLATYGTVSLNVPVYGDRSTSLFGQVGLLVAFKHWDFYGRFGIQDATDTRRPLVAFGAVYRFGN